MTHNQNKIQRNTKQNQFPLIGKSQSEVLKLADLILANTSSQKIRTAKNTKIFLALLKPKRAKEEKKTS